ncbi:MAG: hypothetical protein NC350_04220 [Corallococcus sp.]|nr:hypothetical protein [Corallococcus sp.]
MLEQNKFHVTCDVKNCKNYAKYVFPSKGLSAKFYICQDCVQSLLENYGKMSTPKSPKNAIKKAIEKHEETLRENV